MDEQNYILDLRWLPSPTAMYGGIPLSKFSREGLLTIIGRQHAELRLCWAEMSPEDNKRISAIWRDKGNG